MTGNELRDLRLDAGLTQRELARRLDCTISAISQWEGGINKIQRAYELALIKIFEEEGKEKQS